MLSRSHASAINPMSTIITDRNKIQVVINSNCPSSLRVIQKEPMNMLWLPASPQQFVAQQNLKQNLSCPPAHSLPRGLTQTVCLSVRLSSENAEVQTQPSRRQEGEVCVPTRAGAVFPQPTRNLKIPRLCCFSCKEGENRDRRLIFDSALAFF